MLSLQPQRSRSLLEGSSHPTSAYVGFSLSRLKCCLAIRRPGRRRLYRAAELRETRIVAEALAEPGELVLAVERFSLSANNLTYAVLGNSFGLNY